MKKFYLLMAIVALVAVGCEKDNTGDNKGPVTDEFDPAFAAELQKRGYITDAQNITSEEVAAITELDISSDNYDGELTSLKGIEYFSSLQELKCYGNRLTSLDVSNNAALENLDCSYNDLSSLDASNNTELKLLKCNDNNMGSLDISGNRVLEDLDCSYNNLGSLDVSNNTELAFFQCYSNNLTGLDLSNNTALKYLYCDSNNLATLDISNNTALEYLYCNSNNLTALDISNNTALKFLYCTNNPGDGNIFPVDTWFDDDSIPTDYFTTGSWNYQGNTVTISYRKKK